MTLKLEDRAKEEMRKRLERALSDLLELDVEVHYEDAITGDPLTIVETTCGDSPEVVAAYSGFKESGVAMLLIDLRRAREFLEAVLRSSGLEGYVSAEMLEDMIRELGNQLIGAILSALARIHGETIEYSIPRVQLVECPAIVGELVSSYVYGYGSAFSIEFAAGAGGIRLPIRLIVCTP